MLHGWLEKTLDTLLPPVCVLCRASGHNHLALCRGCREELPWAGRTCETCALPLPRQAHSQRCSRCLQRPPPVAGAYTALTYRPPVDFLVTGLKFRRRLDYARVLGELMAQRLQHTPAARSDYLLPVPLHRQRLRERGFNQAIELARPLARQWRLPIDTQICRRRIATKRQADLDAGARGGNIRGAFSAAAGVRGRHVTIIDDVVTTGHTVFELARCLRRAGAGKVYVCSAARAIR